MATWIVERTQDRRFPFRITIEQEGRTLLAVRAQSHWPGAGSQIFCLRETELDPAEHLEPFERVRVAHLARLGRKLSVTLDRAQRKRCEFLKIEKPFKDRPGTYEQIFFRTEQGVRAHRRSGRVELVPRGGLEVVIDSAELYPWKFPGARVTRRKLPTSAESLINAYKRESQRQRLLVKKARICEGRLTIIVTAFGKLLADENFVNLLRAESLADIPKYLHEKLDARPKENT